jgi:hypothetical protein
MTMTLMKSTLVLLAPEMVRRKMKFVAVATVGAVNVATPLPALVNVTAGLSGETCSQVYVVSIA